MTVEDNSETDGQIETDLQNESELEVQRSFQNEDGGDFEPADDVSSAREERLKQIAKARNRVTEIRTKARMPDRDNTQGAIAYRGALEGFLIELQPLLFQTEKGRFLWSEKEFHTFTIPPKTTDEDRRGPTKMFVKGGKDVKVSSGSVPDPVEVSITGFGDLVKMANPIEMAWKVRRYSTQGRSSKTTVTQYYPILFPPLDKIMESANSYLTEIGLTIGIEEAKGPAKI